MELLIDHASVRDIDKLLEIYPISGVTTNPSILRNCGVTDFYATLRDIRAVIGLNRSLHVQVVSTNPDGIVEEAHRIIKGLDDQVYIKIPITEAGLTAIKQLKKENLNITATAIYSTLQGLTAISSGVNYLAPYVNRMLAMDVDAFSVIKSLAENISRENSRARIVGASFSNGRQITSAIQSGSHAVTVQPAVLANAFRHKNILSAVDSFANDFRATFNCDMIPEP